MALLKLRRKVSLFPVNNLPRMCLATLEPGAHRGKEETADADELQLVAEHLEARTAQTLPRVLIMLRIS